VTKGMPGLGIGLAGVAQSVDQHGGSIHVESEEGRGSRFVVRLPINPNPPEPE
jgi:signal transduction histidine kinase